MPSTIPDYTIEFKGGYIIVRDLNMGARSVTNGAEHVVDDVLGIHGNHPIIYQDSDGLWDRLLHDGTKFTGFGSIDVAEAACIYTKTQIDTRQ